MGSRLGSTYRLLVPWPLARVNLTQHSVGPASTHGLVVYRRNNVFGAIAQQKQREKGLFWHTLHRAQSATETQEAEKQRARCGARGNNFGTVNCAQ